MPLSVLSNPIQGITIQYLEKKSVTALIIPYLKDCVTLAQGKWPNATLSHGCYCIKMSKESQVFTHHYPISFKTFWWVWFIEKTH